MKSAILSTLAVFLVHTLSPTLAAQTGPAETNFRKNICGQYCLTMVLHRLDKDVKFLEIMGVAPVQRPTNMAMLKLFAEAYGLTALGAKAPPETLFAMNMPVIIHVNGNHFITLLPPDQKDGFTVVDPPKRFKSIGLKDFKQHWKTYDACLFINNGPISLPGIDQLPAQPQILVENPVFDAGVVFDDTTVIPAIFRIRNTGGKDLLISKVKTDCRCTTVAGYKKQLKPDENVQLKINFDLGNQFGKMPERNVLVVTNDPENPNTILTINAERRRFFEISPPNALFGVVDVGREKTFLIRITAGSEQAQLNVENAKTSLPAIKVTRIENPVLQMYPRETLLKIRLLPTASVGPFDGSITIPYFSGSSGTLKIRVRGQVKGPIVVSPAELQFGLLNDQQHAIKKQIQLYGEKAFQIISLSADQSWLVLDKSNTKATACTITAKITPQSVPQGQFHGVITIKTNLPDMRLIRIDVLGYHM